jgi:hypothetical protein
MGELDPRHQQALDQARGFYVGHQGAYGAMFAPDAQTMLLKSGVSGGAWGGTDRGGIPRGPGWGFTQGGPSQGNIATHVEGHAAAIMWQRGMTQGILVVSEPMCAICSRDLASALPPGATLLVISEGEGTTIVRSTHAIGEVPELTPSSGPPSAGPKPRSPGNPDPDEPDEPRRGAGGANPTPGFDPSGIQNVANALDLFQHWASQLSMINAAFDAWNEILERKNEIVQAQNDNPIFPVYIRIYWKIDFDNNPNMPKIYHYLGADIQSGAAGMPASLYDGWQHSYLMVIPALKKDDNKKGSGGPITWRDGYRSVLGLLQGDHTTGGDPVAALRVLNGSPMYDILPILQTLKASDPRLFDKLQQALAWPSANVGVDRLRAAFFAVQMSENSGNDAFGCYKSACNEFAALPQDQQKDIENFLSGKSGEERKVLTSPAGEWNVRVGKWLWVYSFDTKGAVTWRDPFNGENGKGKWKQLGGKIMIDWSPSQSKDTWYLPLDAAKQKGMAFVDGEGSFPVAATKN